MAEFVLSAVLSFITRILSMPFVMLFLGNNHFLLEFFVHKSIKKSAIFNLSLVKIVKIVKIPFSFLSHKSPFFNFSKRELLESFCIDYVTMLCITTADYKAKLEIGSNFGRLKAF